MHRSGYDSTVRGSILIGLHTNRIEEKAFAYLEAGTQLVWVLKPRSKTVTVYRSETNITLLTQEDTLTGEEVIKGFSCPVNTLFQ